MSTESASGMSVPPVSEDLQFDRAVTASASEARSNALNEPTTVVCARCQSAIHDRYYHVAGTTVCTACKDSLLDAQRRGRAQHGLMFRALVAGMGAAIVGAIAYYAVMRLLNLEIGIVAILIGYLVGRAIMTATRGVGGRRFQVLAVVLTYFSIGLAYTPFALERAHKGETATVSQGAAPSTHGTAPIAPDSITSTTAPSTTTASSAATSSQERLGVPKALLFLLIGILALPLEMIFSSASGFISAIIIGIGMRQAWRMTAETSIVVTGPYAIMGMFQNDVPLGTERHSETSCTPPTIAPAS